MLFLAVQQSESAICRHIAIQSPGEVNGDPLQYSCLETSMDRGAWWVAVHGVTELDMTKRLTHKHTHIAVCIYSLFFGFPSHDRSPQSTEWSSLCCIRFSFVTYFIDYSNNVYILILISQFIPTPLPPWCPCICSVHLCLFNLMQNSNN